MHAVWTEHRLEVVASKLASRSSSPTIPPRPRATRVGCADADIGTILDEFAASDDFVGLAGFGEKEAEEEEMQRAIALSLQDTTTDDCGANCAVSRQSPPPPQGGGKKPRGGKSSRSSKKPRKKSG